MSQRAPNYSHGSSFPSYRIRFACFAATLIALFPVAGNAALFCVSVNGLPSECSYSDATECERRASQLAGICTVNPQEIKLPTSGSDFCMVGATRFVQCIYSDRFTCDNAARGNNAICVDRTLGTPLPDPFQVNPNRAY